MDIQVFFVSYLIFGAMVGTFLNVLIYRLPIMLTNLSSRSESHGEEIKMRSHLRNINLFQPGSFCHHCNESIPIKYNIPILGWIFLRGASRCCNKKISTRYLFIEVLAVIQTLLVLMIFKEDLLICTSLVLIWSLTALAFIDFDTYLLPDCMTIPLLWLGLLINIDTVFAPLTSAVLGAVSGYLFLWLSYWLFKIVRGIDGMGYGDFKLMAALGAWFGVSAVPFLILFSSFFGLVAYAIFYFFDKKDNGKEINYIAFGPYISLAGVLYLFLGSHVTNLFS
ncbi:prepilin peptidase [Yersinia pseudotuberculosis]|uniref:prepilin peptidase n=1 Tax=Yersinia pseudotuberculosis TaxID=633 RepID=UPI0015F02C7C|nr:A24 family peptidase [Yersinia pseudotuberculosis]